MDDPPLFFAASLAGAGLVPAALVGQCGRFVSAAMQLRSVSSFPSPVSPQRIRDKGSICRRRSSRLLYDRTKGAVLARNAMRPDSSCVSTFREFRQQDNIGRAWEEGGSCGWIQSKSGRTLAAP